jgi:hypothetical protein
MCVASFAQTEIIAFSDRAKEFAEIDTAVRSVTRNCLLVFAQGGRASFALHARAAALRTRA